MVVFQIRATMWLVTKLELQFKIHCTLYQIAQLSNFNLSHLNTCISMRMHWYNLYVGKLSDTMYRLNF